MNLDLDKLFPARVVHMREVAEAGGMCLETDDGYKCSEPIGHKGPHKAHSSLMAVLHTWEKK